MPYYPETTVIRGLARLTRERRLPPGAVHRRTAVGPGAQASAVTVVLQGDVLREYHFLDVASALRLRRARLGEVSDLIAVAPDQRVRLGQELATRGRGKRTQALLSPADGQVISVDDGQIIIQASEQSVEVLAKTGGLVESVENDVVRISSVGAVMQCAWGNGRFFFGAFQFLPEEGFAALGKLDSTMSPYRARVIISALPVERADLLAAHRLEAAGVVAPSMSASLREFALGLTFPIILTEGFGRRQPTALIYRLLLSNSGRQAAFDAAVPDPWSWERPEIVLPLPTGGIFPEAPSTVRALEPGAEVRLTRAPWDGIVAQVVALPPTPQGH